MTSKRKSRKLRDKNRHVDLRHCAECDKELPKRNVKDAEKRGEEHLYCDECSAPDNLV